jgi:seryl-tRNA synthetase
MLDQKFIRENPEIVRQALKNRNDKFDFDSFLALDEQRRKLLRQIEEFNASQNKIDTQIKALLKEKKDTSGVIEEAKEIKRRISELNKEFAHLEANFKDQLLHIPNIVHSSVPIGGSANSKIVKEWGQIRNFDFKPKDHIVLAEHLDIIDFKTAAKITGSNFVLFKGEGARLERALFNFMLDLHTQKHGYEEIFSPFLVNRDSMRTTGQLPKLEEDMYRLKDDDLFLIPTAEVPVTNIYRDEIIAEEDLPVYFAAYSACFRREAGSYGKDTKGLMRVHQFDKVELVKFVKPQDSYDELEKLLTEAISVLELLGLSYRVIMLSTQDISFAAAKCYDIEIYAPGLDKWLEVSSCSNFEDFQARRGNIRYKEKDGKTKFVHTLNGSGVALARLVISILENYQNEDGSVNIPKVLIPYMENHDKIAV